MHQGSSISPFETIDDRDEDLGVDEADDEGEGDVSERRHCGRAPLPPRRNVLLDLPRVA